jgi:predicted TPR repeat methyltransferase
MTRPPESLYRYTPGARGNWAAFSRRAWLRLGEAEEKRKNAKDAKEAYAKYLELQPEAKDAAEIHKKIASLH